MTDCAGLDVDNAAGIKATITMASGWENSGAGGGIIFNSDDKNGGTGWEQFEWGITGEGTDAKNTDGVTISGSDGKFTITDAIYILNLILNEDGAASAPARPEMDEVEEGPIPQ
jgi:hypothetical protein